MDLWGFEGTYSERGELFAGMTAGAIASLVSGVVGAATGVASGIAQAASGGDKRPKLGEQGQVVADNLANTFASRVSGSPQLGTGLGQPNAGVMPATPNLTDIKNRMGGVGKSLGLVSV